jgi:hypothetical protein
MGFYTKIAHTDSQRNSQTMSLDSSIRCEILMVMRIYTEDCHLFVSDVTPSTLAEIFHFREAYCLQEDADNGFL